MENRWYPDYHLIGKMETSTDALNDGKFEKKYLKILIDFETEDNVDGKWIFLCGAIDSC